MKANNFLLLAFTFFIVWLLTFALKQGNVELIHEAVAGYYQGEPILLRQDAVLMPLAIMSFIAWPSSLATAALKYVLEKKTS